jgi:hypothetical protein
MVENTDEALLKLVGSRIKSLRKDRKLYLVTQQNHEHGQRLPPSSKQ